MRYLLSIYFRAPARFAFNWQSW